MGEPGRTAAARSAAALGADLKLGHRVLVEQVGLSGSAVRVTNAAGIHAQPLAEFVLTAVLHFVKEMPRLAQWKLERHWKRFCAHELTGSKMVLIGLGMVGSRIAQVSSALGIEVIGDRRRLKLLPPPAVLINVGGSLVDKEALVEMLESEHLCGAAPDVFAPEPLPTESKFWSMPNVIVSPHSAGTVVQENDRLVDLFIQNLRRYLDGLPLINEFDHSRKS